MKEYFLKELVGQVVTREDFILLSEEINQVEKLIFKEVNIPLSEKVKGKTREEFRDFLKKIEKENSHFLNPNQQLSFFQNLKKNLKNIPQLKLELAFQPSAEFLLKIKQWFKEKNRQEVILDLLINPEIVGGAIIEYRGKYKNLSVEKKIDELFSKNTYAQ